MKRYIVAAAVAAALGLGDASRADAQIVYGHSVPNGSGMMTGSSFFVPGGFNNRNMFSPSLRDVTIEPTFGTFGANRFNEFNRFSQFDRMGFRNNFFQLKAFQPSFFGTPSGGFNGNNFFMGRGRR